MTSLTSLIPVWHCDKSGSDQQFDNDINFINVNRFVKYLVLCCMMCDVSIINLILTAELVCWFWDWFGNVRVGRCFSYSFSSSYFQYLEKAWCGLDSNLFDFLSNIVNSTLIYWLSRIKASPDKKFSITI